MSRLLRVIEAGPSVSVQDLGRPGYLACGLSCGGAADRLALLEGAALLGQDPDAAALEMVGRGGVFEADGALRIALTGARMEAKAGGRTLEWNASHRIEAGQRLTIGGTRSGVYGYLHVGGGIATASVLGSRSAHLNVRLIGAVTSGAALPLGPDPDPSGAEMALAPPDRMDGGTVRILPVAQTALFAPAELARFEATVFTRDPRGNRHGVRLAFEGDPFRTEGQLDLLSEIVTPGDIQMTGTGDPYVLLPECQTTGGYPRIGTVHPGDLPVVAQAAPGRRLQFRFVTLEEALAAQATEAAALRRLAGQVHRRVRDVAEMSDLLSYQLISGVTAGDELDPGQS